MIYVYLSVNDQKYKYLIRPILVTLGSIALSNFTVLKEIIGKSLFLLLQYDNFTICC